MNLSDALSVTRRTVQGARTMRGVTDGEIVVWRYQGLRWRVVVYDREQHEVASHWCDTIGQLASYLAEQLSDYDNETAPIWEPISDRLR